jgi:hypothetical protein
MFVKVDGFTTSKILSLSVRSGRFRQQCNLMHGQVSR